MTSALKASAGALLYRVSRMTGCTGRLLRRLDGSAILMYHRVLPKQPPTDWPFPSLVVDADSFALQMRWLAKEFRVCTVHELLARVPSDKPCAAVTFDDGYSDNALYAAPILEQAGIRGTFFVTTKFIGGSTRLWFDVAARISDGADAETGPESTAHRMKRWKSMTASERQALLERSTVPDDWRSTNRDLAMTADDLHRMAKAGHEIGSHTRTHPILTRSTPDELVDEIAGSVADLRRLGIEPSGIAYPNGDYSESVVAAVRDSGLRYGVSTSLGWCTKDSCVLAIPRVDVNMRRLNRWHKDPVEGLKAELSWLRIGRA